LSLLESENKPGIASSPRSSRDAKTAGSAGGIGDLCCHTAATTSWSVVFADGSEQRFGNDRPAFTVKVHDEAFWQSIQRKSTWAAALAFVRGDIDIAGDLSAAIRWWSSRREFRLTDWIVTALSRLSPERIQYLFFQSRRRAARNIQFHYDRSNEFYKCFLDRNLVYSCAYFERPENTLDQAQIAKLEHICRKLELVSSDRFLDIGCGWGALPLHAAAHYGVKATGCTLSHQQFAWARERVVQEGYADTVRIFQSDYRDLKGRFDKIASVGMFEHVGRRRLPEYFRRVSDLMEPDGLFLNHGIIRPKGFQDGAETVFLRRFVFPGSELAHLAEVIGAAEDAGFEVLDVENLRPHYALTTREWVSRLQLSRELAMRLAGPETYRTWLLYLAASSVSFDDGYMDLCQLLLAKRGSKRLRHLTRAHLYES
jgi:cyclopropane-fatty-acyl-phospholipid synthase